MDHSTLTGNITLFKTKKALLCEKHFILIWKLVKVTNKQTAFQHLQDVIVEIFNEGPSVCLNLTISFLSWDNMSEF